MGTWKAVSFSEAQQAEFAVDAEGKVLPEQRVRPCRQQPAFTADTR